MKKWTIISVLILCFSISTYSQRNMSFHAGLAVPLCNWGYEPAVNASLTGGQKNGLNLGIQYAYPIKLKGIALSIGLDYFYNPVNSEVTNRITDILSHMSKKTLSISNSYKYHSFPLLVGLNYSLNIYRSIDWYVDAGIGLNFLKISDMSVLENNTVFLKYTFDWSTREAYSLGSGVALKNRYVLGISYYGLGNKNVQGYQHFVTTSDVPPTGSLTNLNIKIVSIKAGIKF